MIYEDKTGLIRRGLFDVQNEVGLGRKEEVYHQAFHSWLMEQNIPHFSKKPHPLMVHEEVAHVLCPDFVAWDCISIEMKAVPRHLRDEERVQIFNYLKRREDKLGLLVNMGLDRVHVERIVYDRPCYEMSENWEAWRDTASEPAKDVGQTVRQMLTTLYREHQTGYGSEVTERLITFGLGKEGLSFTANPPGPSMYHGQAMGESPLACLIVEKELVVVFTALFDDNNFNIQRCRSFMKALELNWGIAINFGKRKLEINGISHRTE
ncbi:MAG: GxxExxY protein [Lentisphaerota bacterium]